ncbi:MAG: hypothetical protein ACPGVG_12545, partial [Mycobacterium sp.]
REGGLLDDAGAAMKRALVIAALAPLLMGGGVVMKGVKASGVFVPGTTISAPSWVSCASDNVARYSMDETGENDREDTGQCGDECDLSATTGVTHAAGVRGNAATTTASATQELTCTNATCDELDRTGSFSWAGYLRPPVAPILPGLFFDTWDAGDNDGLRISAGGTAVAAQTLAVTASVSILDASKFQFVFVSWDETNDELKLCVSNEDNAWTCDTESATGPFVASGIDPTICLTLQGTIYCDEMSLWNLELSEEDACRVCACYPDGTGCTISGTRWVDTGHLGTVCKGCTLPADASKACPT